MTGRQKKTKMWTMKATELDRTNMDFVKAKFGLSSRAAAVRFSLNHTAKNGKVELNKVK